MKTKSAAKAWLLTLAIAGVIYVAMWRIAGLSLDIDKYGYTRYASFWEPVPLLAGLFFLIILGLPLFISKEKRGGKLALVAGCWVFYLPILRGSLFPAIAEVVSRMLIPIGAGSFVYRLVDSPFSPFPRNGMVAEWLGGGFLEAHFVAAHALIAIGLAITIVGFVQILRAIREKRLVTQGLYATVRHPQHLGIALWTLGMALAVARTIGFMAWFTVVYFYLLLAIREERQLARQFGEEYQSYRKGTPFMIPFIQTSLPLPEEGWRRIGVLIALYLLGLTILCLILSAVGVEIIYTF